MSAEKDSGWRPIDDRDGDFPCSEVRYWMCSRCELVYEVFGAAYVCCPERLLPMPVTPLGEERLTAASIAADQ